MIQIPTFNINQFSYVLPQERIAQFPLHERDQSKLLVYQNGKVSSDHFYNITSHLPERALMIYNETRVIQARMIFKKETGAAIEIFCLEPVEPTRELMQAFEQGSGVVWKCLVGNSKKWKSGPLYKKINCKSTKIKLQVDRIKPSIDYSLVQFKWDDQKLRFSDILECTGYTPLPPYVNREVTESDKIRYQTIYAQSEGSVAAPTAGLHFTKKVLNSLKKKQIDITNVTLHVGAGTFKPIASDDIRDHQMHKEQIYIHRNTVSEISKSFDRKLIAVGTTSVRTVESLYWHGVKMILGKSSVQRININQWDPYDDELNKQISPEESVRAVLREMEKQNIDNISGITRLIIVPGYSFKLVELMVTNFHMPKSTLLLLVSAFIGKDWKQVYNYALKNNYRFLSYGDSSLLFRSIPKQS